jgi:hypothetical protein
MSKWITIDNHSTLSGKDFYISYVSTKGQPKNQKAIMKMFDTLLSLTIDKDVKRTDETALVKGKTYLILNGDYRKQYEQLVPKGYKACKDFYTKNIKNQSIWSTDRAYK